MINYYTKQNCLVRNVSRMLCAAVLILAAFTFASAQPCPTTPGPPRESISLEDGNTTHGYPVALPAGVTTGSPNVTHGGMYHSGAKGTATPLTTVTIHPQWSDGTMGWVVINFYYLEIESSGAIIKVYDGDGTSTTPVATITSANASTYYRFNHKNNGPITVTMENTASSATGDFDVEIPFMTGEVVYTSPLAQEITYWKQFITPNSRAWIDSRAGSASTIATGYFDANRDLVSSEVSWCIDYGQSAPRRGNYYPGEMVYNPTARPDIDEDGVVTTEDKLKTARLIYILQHAPQPISDMTNSDEVRAAVDDITHFGSGSADLAAAAIVAIPSLPSPEEPTFAITGPAASAPAGTPQNFVVNLTNDGGHPRIYKLKVPAGVTVNTVTGTGVTYDTANQDITFASAPASATVSVTSASSQTATLGVAYEQPGFWNVDNLVVYEPCDYYETAPRNYQGFLGLSKAANPYPFREASATWAAVDYGDLPDTYATLAASNGASHAITAYNATAHTSSLMLGSQIDSDADGTPNTVATGDDLAEIDDEDAITRFPVLVPGSTSYSITLPVTNTTGTTATVKGWIDFNKDGAFGAGEEATQTVSDGATSVTLNWPGFPAVANFGYIHARFRIASVASEIASPTGAANSGEVEDYRFFIGRTVAGTVFNDINRNTRIDSGEPFTSLPAPMYVYMVQNNVIVDAATVAADGSYLLLAPAGQTSALHLSAVQYPIGTDVTGTPINHTPPSGWTTSGENGSGSNTGSGDLSPDGILSVTVTTENLIQRNFGIRYQVAGTSGGYDICATDTSILPLADFIDGEDAGGTWSYVSGSGITFDPVAGTVQLTSSATTSTYRYDIPATGGNPGSFSIATVTVRPVPVTYQSKTICQGESVCIFNPAGTARTVEPQEQICHTTSGVYSDTLVGASHFGCDSIVVTTLTVVPIPDAGTDGAVTACTNDATPIDLFSLISGEQTGGSWARLTGTGGTFDAAAGTFTPAAGATASTFSYTIAGAGSCPEDVSVATVNLNTCNVQISGTIFNDANGLSGSPVNTVDGTPIQLADGAPLYANLFTAAGVFVASVPVDASGNYSFSVSPGTEYLVTVSTTAATNGSAPAGSTGLPTGWVNTGEFVGSGAGNDLAPNGTLTVSVGTTSVTNANFGLERQPNSNSVTHILTPDPIPNQEILLDGADAPLMNGSDPEDGTYSGGTATPGNDPKGVVITSLPTNGQLWYYGFGAPVVVSASDVTNGTLFNDPSLFTVVLTGAGYTSTSFNYAYVDAAGVVDPTPATYLISWSKPLPVTLISFDVTTESKIARLKWATTSETNSKGFEIQRSANASDWTKIGFVEAQSQGATVTSKLSYDFTDANPLNGVNYYRLKMVDLDATFAYSQIRTIRMDDANAMALYPNPVVQGKLTIDVTNAEAYHAEIINMAGITVLTQSLAKTRELNVNRLASGLYVLRITSASGDVQTKPFVVK